MLDVPARVARTEISGETNVPQTGSRNSGTRPEAAEARRAEAGASAAAPRRSSHTIPPSNKAEKMTRMMRLRRFTCAKRPRPQPPRPPPFRVARPPRTCRGRVPCSRSSGRRQCERIEKGCQRKVAESQRRPAGLAGRSRRACSANRSTTARGVSALAGAGQPCAACARCPMQRGGQGLRDQISTVGLLIVFNEGDPRCGPRADRNR